MLPFAPSRTDERLAATFAPSTGLYVTLPPCHSQCEDAPRSPSCVSRSRIPKQFRWILKPTLLTRRSRTFSPKYFDQHQATRTSTSRQPQFESSLDFQRSLNPLRACHLRKTAFSGSITCPTGCLPPASPSPPLFLVRTPSSIRETVVPLRP